MTMTNGVYDNGLTPIRGFCPKAKAKKLCKRRCWNIFWSRLYSISFLFPRLEYSEHNLDTQNGLIYLLDNGGDLGLFMGHILEIIW